MKKQLLGIFAALFVFVALLPAGAYAADNVYALLYSDGTLVFQNGDAAESGTGRTLMATYPVDLTADYSWDSENQVATTPWYDERESVLMVTFADTVKPASTAYWFYGCSNLRRVSKIDNLDTSNVTNMSWMFYQCGGLTALDLSHFDTAKVTTMERMFSYCGGLTALDLSKFNTANVTNMTDMFSYTGLKTLDLSGFNTANVKYMEGVFYDCTALTALNLSGLDTSKVTTMRAMFALCTSLKALDLSGFDNSNVTDMHEMFSCCYALKELDLSDFNTSNVAYMHNMFYNCDALITLDLSSFDTSNVTDMHDMFYSCEDLTILNLSSFDTVRVMDMHEMFSGCGKLRKIYASDKFTIDFALELGFYTIENMFYNCYSLVGDRGTSYSYDRYQEYARIDNPPDAPGYFTAKTDVPLDMVYALLYDDGELVFQHSAVSSESWRTVRETYPVDLTATDDTPPWYDERWHVEVVSFADKVSPTSTANWFSDCISLQRVDNIRNLDTSNVTSMSAMFYNCYSLTALDVSSFDTSKVTDMGAMFERCSGLTALDVSGFNTSGVTDMGWMFWDCSGLTALDVSGFNTSGVTNMSRMFCGCSGLTALDVSHFNTASVTNMENMFDDCGGLTALDVSGFNTSGVTDMSWMFWRCWGLTTLDVSRFDTAKVKEMDYMFGSCSNLTALDVSGFDTAQVMTTESMFDGCTRLKTIYASGKFTTDSVRETDFSGSRDMFRDCTALVGGAGTEYDENHTYKEYARIDNPPDAPGYFTAKDAVMPVPAPVTYTVTWKNYDGAVLKTDTGLAAGTVPAYGGVTPIRTGYAFAGWSPEPSALTGDATYTAQFTEIAPILFDVTRDAYAFGNSMADFGYTSAGGPGGGKHPITPNSFFVIFGETVKAKMLYKQKTAFPWGGNCAGMSGSAALFYANTGLNPSDFGQNNVWGVKIGDKNAEMSALTFVEAMQVAQYADAFVKARQENNRTAADLRGVKNLNALFETVRTDMEAGRPTLLAIVKSGVGGHALLAIGAENVSDTESRIRIYDCNHPGEARYLTLGKDASGNLKTWSYDMSNYGVWGTGSDNGDACSISCVPYAVLEEIWTNRGNQKQNSQVLTVNADNLTITDFDGNPVASVENGQFSANADGVYEIVELSMYWPKERSVCLPRNETYTLTTTDDITLTASMTDSHMSAEISTSANEVTFGVNDDEKENGVIVAGATASDTYEIALESDFADMPYKNVSLSGSGQGEDVSVSMNQDGAPVFMNCNITNLSLNGKSMLYDILIATPDKDKGKLSVAFTNFYPVTAAAAYFDANGKFMSAHLQSVQTNAKTAEFPLPTDAKTARVILCDSDCRPLCEPYEAKVG